FRIPHSPFRIGVGGEVSGMIQIIAGEFKNRRLKTPAGTKTRPTGNRVREAWFNILQRSVRGARVLDLYAGSGALGLEALSRGAGPRVLTREPPADTAIPGDDTRRYGEPAVTFVDAP